MASAQKFFESRHITIPELDPFQWREHLGEKDDPEFPMPIAANFSMDILTGMFTYISGTGSTMARWKGEIKGLEVYDLIGTPEHHQKLLDECIDAVEEAGQDELKQVVFRESIDGRQPGLWPYYFVRTEEAGSLPLTRAYGDNPAGNLVAVIPL